MSKKIFIYAYAKLNLGDDLFIKMLCDRYPQAKFYIQAPKHVSQAFENIDNLVVIPAIRFVDKPFVSLGYSPIVNESFSRLVSKFCDGIINIGGSIFIEPENWETKIKKIRKNKCKE